MAETGATPLLYDETLRGIRDLGEYIEIGASATVTDLLVSPVMQSIFPDLYKHLKLVSSTPIRTDASLMSRLNVNGVITVDGSFGSTP